MCGIFFTNSLFQPSQCMGSIANQQLRHRGPHSYQEITFLNCMVCASVLNMRGALTKQPVTTNDVIFCWNGELFSNDKVSSADKNDTAVIFEQLLECTNEFDVLQLISVLHGPYAFIFASQILDIMIFGRDIFGRRSLVFGRNDSDDVFISSVCHDYCEKWMEIPAVGLYSCPLSLISNKSSDLTFTLHRWSLHSNINSTFNLCDFSVILSNDVLRCSVPSTVNSSSVLYMLNENCDIHSDMLSATNPIMGTASDQLLSLLSQSVAQRVQLLPPPKPDNSQARVALLFSGGLDSTTLAILAHKWLPPNEPIDLLNVAFESQPARLNPTGQKQRQKQRKTQDDSAVNFDGQWLVPDRVTGLSSLEELITLCPDRTWNFVEVNISLSELRTARSQHIAPLLQPCVSILDDSLGCAVWFAARGVGVLHSTGEHYSTAARVLLTGIGADEQLAGYSRHRVVYQRAGGGGPGYAALGLELDMELKRIGERNLGRDDRMISDHGREARMPYLDETVVSFLAELPPSLKADMELSKGLGEKLLLRLVAWKLGLRGAARQPKRALQFGSHIAKTERVSGRRGSDRWHETVT